MENRPKSLVRSWDLKEVIEKRKVRNHPLSSRGFRSDLLTKTFQKKIDSFQEIKDQKEECPENTRLFVEGLLIYLGDNSNYPYGYYPEGLTKIENCYPDDDTWKVSLVYSAEGRDKPFDATIKMIQQGNRSIDAIEEYLEDDRLHCVAREILKENIRDNELEYMMEHMKESDGDDAYDEDEEPKLFECEECPICYEKLENPFIPKCGHPVCLGCKENINKCPTCRGPLEINGRYYDDAVEWLENEIDEAVERELNEKLVMLVDVWAVAHRCYDDDGLAHSLGFQYEVDWEEDHHWMLNED
jgi:hypothetical protein